MEQSRSTGPEKKFVGAEALQELGIVSKSAAYRMAEAGLLPCYRVGLRRHGLRFNVDEVLSALRCPVSQV